ncbi:unnamed protein product [Ostreobium quekettii]|uniref:Uncharacterized protein n=1 Tax=Ostreobium quekettii TaxID=121088 RepID=A0A8S1IYB7_9CHLO|nr:unnamed protein product [Ostreobium quekettii]|eukprot:evm.model.scf_1012.4 EVM.evm.TU.scf_1012.4   scf_1012:17563-21940(-)
METSELGVAAGLLAPPATPTRRPSATSASAGRRHTAKVGSSHGRPRVGPLLRPSLGRAPTAREATEWVDAVTTRAENGRGGGGFVTGFLVGGVVCGVLGFLYAPQISRTLLDEQQRLKLPKFLEDKPPVPVTKDELVLRVDELNAAVDQLAQNLGDRGGDADNSKDPQATKVPA